MEKIFSTYELANEDIIEPYGMVIISATEDGKYKVTGNWKSAGLEKPAEDILGYQKDDK